jgi:hypothetical protein
MKLSSAFTNTFSTIAVSTLVVFGFAFQAQAMNFLSSSSGKWGQPTPGDVNPMPYFSGVGTNTFTWGIPNLFGTPANQLTFTGNSFSVNSHSIFKLGNFNYYNGTVPLGTSVDSVPLTLSFTSNEAPEVNGDYTFEFDLLNTLNTGNIEENDDNSDFVVEKTLKRDRFFTLQGKKYAFELAGFSEDGGQTLTKELKALEKKQISAGLFARVKEIPSEKIPEPAMVIGLGVLGCYLLNRKKA